jgi:hypothetical protein
MAPNFQDCPGCTNLTPPPGGTLDPKLGPLQDLGGGTLVYPLLPDSPAIDAFETLNGAKRVDQRHLPRPSDGNGDGNARDGSSGSVSLSPLEPWSQLIPAGGSSHSLGFCADRPDGSGILPGEPSVMATF